jgi:hypothetical protein
LGAWPVAGEGGRGGLGVLGRRGDRGGVAVVAARWLGAPSWRTPVGHVAEGLAREEEG